MPEPFKIKCQYCNNIYVANKKNRSHCRRSNCRHKEIKKQLDMLASMLKMLCDNNIEAIVEVRLAGNDKISREAKIESTSNLKKLIEKKNVSDNNSNDDDDDNGIKPEILTSYFRVLLWKGVRGNFIIKTFNNGTINPKILNQTFTPLSMPMIIGNNLLVWGQSGEKQAL